MKLVFAASQSFEKQVRSIFKELPTCIYVVLEMLVVIFVPTFTCAHVWCAAYCFLCLPVWLLRLLFWFAVVYFAFWLLCLVCFV